MANTAHLTRASAYETAGEGVTAKAPQTPGCSRSGTYEPLWRPRRLGGSLTRTALRLGPRACGAEDRGRGAEWDRQRHGMRRDVDDGDRPVDVIAHEQRRGVGREGL